MFANNNGIDYIEVSALTGENIKLIFEELTKSMIKLNEFIEKKRKKEKKDRPVKANQKLSVEGASRITVTEGSNAKCC